MGGVLIRGKFFLSWHTKTLIEYEVNHPCFSSQNLLTWFSSITASSLAYLFSPNNTASAYTPVFALFSVFIGEHLFIALRYFITSLLSLLPSRADEEVRRQEYSLKKRWLDKVAGAKQIIDGVVTIEGEKQPGLAKFWEAVHEEEEGEELIRASFKSK